MGAKIIKFSDLIAKPWPNGMGITRDIIGSNPSDGRLGWLISIADLVVDAEFSHFQGCDRVFTLVLGEGVELYFRDTAPVRCQPLVPVAFPGDTPTCCRVTAGPARALNVFARRTGSEAIVSALTLAQGHHLRLRSNPTAIHCAFGSVTVQGQCLAAGDTAINAIGPVITSVEEATGLVLVYLALDPSKSED